MKILITSGGTTENIDAVRGITNHATGTLGKEVAECFLAQEHDVTLVTTQRAVKPKKHSKLKIILVETVADLIAELEPLVKTHDAIIHSMAVSDYTPVYVTDLEEVEKAPAVKDLLHKSNTSAKISSQQDYQVLFLKKTPKVISLIKQWNPDIMLIGFKLLVGVPKEELLAVARRSLATNQAHYIVANDLTTIDDNQHLAYLVGKDDVVVAKTKKAIAELILERVTHD